MGDNDNFNHQITIYEDNMYVLSQNRIDRTMIKIEGIVTEEV